MADGPGQIYRCSEAADQRGRPADHGDGFVLQRDLRRGHRAYDAAVSRVNTVSSLRATWTVWQGTRDGVTEVMDCAEIGYDVLTAGTFVRAAPGNRAHLQRR